MAKVTILFTCGCGFRAGNPIEAVVHSDRMSHTLEVMGKVQPDKDKRKEVKPDALGERGE